MAFDPVTAQQAAAQAKDSEGNRLDARPSWTRASYDVVVVGATEVGVLAAVRAARQGCRVLLASENDRVGGNVGYGITMMDIIATVSPMVLTGLAREFFSRCARLNTTDHDFVRWYRLGGPIKPTWAKRVFREMIAAEKNITLLPNSPVQSVTKTGTKITTVTLGGISYAASIVIDATATGDVARLAGCTISVGRESSAQYSEGASAGVVLNGVYSSADPYVTPGTSASGLLFGISPRAVAAAGTADNGVMTMGWRLMLTSVTAEKLPWPTTPPTGYDASKYELLARIWAANAAYSNATDGSYANAQTKALARAFSPYNFSGGGIVSDSVAQYADLNSLGYVSTNYPNAAECLEYVTATFARRQQIEANALAWLKGLFYFITQSGDARVPANLKAGVNLYGLSSLELPEYGGWNPQFYIREGARIVGDYVMTAADLSVSATTTALDRIAWWCYDFDAHAVRLYAESGVIKSEGQVGGTAALTQYGSPIPMRVLFPKAAEVTNLLCPGQPSVSRVVYTGLRAVPTMMVLGDAAGCVAAEALRSGSTVQAVNAKNVQAIQNLSGFLGSVSAASASGEYNLQCTVTENGSGAAFANVTTGIRFGPQQGTATLQSVAAGVVRSKRFAPTIFRPGRYRVVHIYAPTQAGDTAGIARASNVQVTISHADGTSTRNHSQRFPGPGNGYDVLGEFFFDYGTPSAHYVEINTSGATTDGLVVVGIVAFIPVDDQTRSINGI